LKEVSFPEGQSGDAWLKWRKTGIGASDIGVLMGSNTYKTIFKLWNEKSGFEKDAPMNPAIAHGIKNEPIAREWINKDQNINLTPICLEDVDNSHFKASLDGYDPEKKVLCEIKCPVSKSILDKAKDSQVVPKYWIDQVQWQIMICKPVRAFIAVWDHRTKDCTTVEIFAKPDVQKKMRKKANDFWRSVEVGIVPKASLKDFINIKDGNLEALLLKYRDNVKAVDEFYHKRMELRNKIESYSDGGNFKCAGFSLQRYTSKKSYDLEKMRDDGINVDKYLKKSKKQLGYFKIFLPKKTDDEGFPLK